MAVAPLRVARGIQNKVLEAMAMGLPVVVARGCGEAVDACAGKELLLADDARDFAGQVDRLLRAPAMRAAMGDAARERVLRRYSWDAHLSAIDRYLDARP
jgi:glycosyltransferase involved in cell wall biosynthesis